MGRSHFLSCYWTVGVNSDCEFLLFVIAQPPDTILHSGQTKVGNDSVPWNSIITSEVGELGCGQWKFVTLCHERFFSHLDHSWGNFLNYLELHTLSAQRRYLDVFFFFLRMFSVVQNIVLPVWKLLVYTCQTAMLKTLAHFILTLDVETVLLLDVLWRQTPSTMILI